MIDFFRKQSPEERIINHLKKQNLEKNIILETCRDECLGLNRDLVNKILGVKEEIKNEDEEILIPYFYPKFKYNGLVCCGVETKKSYIPLSKIKLKKLDKKDYLIRHYRSNGYTCKEIEEMGYKVPFSDKLYEMVFQD